MILSAEGIIVFSENAKKLSDFYEEKVGLEITFEAKMTEDSQNLFAFEMEEGSVLYIVDNKKVRGKNKDPNRIMISFEFDDIKEEVKRLKDNGVRLIQDIYSVIDYGLVSIFEDLDGNHFQIVQITG
ncbi:MAG: VOC family protein [Patescibacteria group bacterium]|nr:VOC family protein [Patescibacteria group bacterium]